MVFGKLVVFCYDPCAGEAWGAAEDSRYKYVPLDSLHILGLNNGRIQAITPVAPPPINKHLLSRAPFLISCLRERVSL